MVDVDVPIDALESELVALEGVMGRMRLRQAELLACLEAAQVAVMTETAALERSVGR